MTRDNGTRKMGQERSKRSSVLQVALARDHLTEHPDSRLNSTCTGEVKTGVILLLFIFFYQCRGNNSVRCRYRNLGEKGCLCMGDFQEGGEDLSEDLQLYSSMG